MSHNQYKSLWFPSKQSCDYKILTYPTTKKNQHVRLESTYSLVSQGTEKLVFDGDVPSSIQNDMKVPYQIGEFSFPCNYGYSLVGKVIEGPEDLVSKHVHVMHPHATGAYVFEHDLTIIPDHLDLTLAPLISQIQTAITAIWDAKVTLGDRISIVGFGLIGACIGLILNERSDLEIEISEPNPFRRSIAKKMGFNCSEEMTASTHIDTAFYCTGNPKALDTTLDQLREEGQLICCAWFGTSPIHMHLGHAFHSKRLKIISSQVGKIPQQLRANWSYKKRNTLALKLLEHSSWSNLPKSITPFNELSRKYPAKLIDHPLIQLISYQ